jgi:hypothetical protein
MNVETIPQGALDAITMPSKRLPAVTYELVNAAFDAGHYAAVAEIDASGETVMAQLEHAYRLTQNGGESESWSLARRPGVRPLAPAYYEHEGRLYGRRSSRIGDVFGLDGKLYVCAGIGFDPL